MADSIRPFKKKFVFQKDTDYGAPGHTTGMPRALFIPSDGDLNIQLAEDEAAVIIPVAKGWYIAEVRQILTGGTSVIGTIVGYQ